MNKRLMHEWKSSVGTGEYQALYGNATRTWVVYLRLSVPTGWVRVDSVYVPEGTDPMDALRMAFPFSVERAPESRTYRVELRHDKGKVRLTLSATDAEAAVRTVCLSERAPLRAVQRVWMWPTCDYCTRTAELYERGSEAPLCKGCARSHCDNVRADTGRLGVTRLTVVDRSEWDTARQEASR
jgi:hypothetical protein